MELMDAGGTSMKIGYFNDDVLTDVHEPAVLEHAFSTESFVVDDSFETFCEQGKRAIAGSLCRQSILALVRAGNASWHPSGFAVFSIAEHQEYSIRLHVWPGDGRRKLAWHPLPHSHDKHLVSKIIAGQKCDIRHEVFLSRSAGNQRVYVIRRDIDGLSKDQILPTDILATFVRNHVQHYSSGDWCAQKAGTFHSIPPDSGEIAATICAKSASICADLQRLIGPTQLPFSAATRPEVTAAERASICRNLEACFAQS